MFVTAAVAEGASLSPSQHSRGTWLHRVGQRPRVVALVRLVLPAGDSENTVPGMAAKVSPRRERSPRVELLQVPR